MTQAITTMFTRYMVHEHSDHQRGTIECMVVNTRG